jgi:thiol-disulfide isomerase/thioredoxin
MRKLAACLLFCAACASPTPRLKQHATGAEFSLQDFRGRIVLLNFWADWCNPCMEEIPELLQITSDYGGKVLLVAVYYDEEVRHRQSVERWLQKQPPIFTKHIVWGNRELLFQYPHPGLPTTYLLGRNGGTLEVFQGAVLGVDRTTSLRQAIQRGLSME